MFALDSNGEIERSIGKAQWHPTFDVDWGRGQVFGGRTDRLLLDATMSIVVSRPGWVWFEIGGDDGFELYVDGEAVLEDWRDGAVRRWGRYLWMQPGIHELHLRYYEWTDRAELLFSASPDVLTWYEAVGCDQNDKARLSASSTSAVVFDGRLLPSSSDSPRVVVLQGIDSKSSCEDVRLGWEFLLTQRWLNGELYQTTSTTSFLPTPEPVPSGDDLFMRRQTLVEALQDHIPGNWESDVLGFSYSGAYENCATGKPYSAEAYPLGDHRAFPAYRSIDTCGGVRNGAIKLGSLLTSIHLQEPDRDIVLIGHSLGGMVAAFYLVELAPPEIRAKITSIVTIDSPLLGYASMNPLSACPSTAQSWKDIFGDSDILQSINAIQETSLAKKFVHLNSTDVGDYLVGGREVGLECGKESAVGSGLVGAVLGTVLTGGLGGFIAGAFGGELYGTYGPGHSCGFYDPAALGEIIDIVRQ